MQKSEGLEKRQPAFPHQIPALTQTQLVTAYCIDALTALYGCLAAWLPCCLASSMSMRHTRPRPYMQLSQTVIGAVHDGDGTREAGETGFEFNTALAVTLSLEEHHDTAILRMARHVSAVLHVGASRQAHTRTSILDASRK